MNIFHTFIIVSKVSRENKNISPTLPGSRYMCAMVVGNARCIGLFVLINQVKQP